MSAKRTKEVKINVPTKLWMHTPSRSRPDCVAGDLASLEVAIVHYWFISWRGGEKVVAALLKLFPRADIYTLFFDSNACGHFLANHQVFASRLNTSFLRQNYQKIYPLYPLAVKSLKLRKKYDLIISSESGPAKGISNPGQVPHLSYVHTPMRYCWGFANDYLGVLPVVARGPARLGFELLRRWDLTTVGNVDHYVANSTNVQGRIRRFYGKESSVVHPPIDLNLFDRRHFSNVPLSKRAYFLSFGAITPYKKIDLLVDAFNRNGRRLIVVGEGSERRRLMERARPNIHFTGALPWCEIEPLIFGAKALLFPGEEDFGMIPLEVMAHGIPVIALGRGGALETVLYIPDRIEESTGIFFNEQTVDSLECSIQFFEKVQDAFQPDCIRQHARGFGEDIFLEKIIEEIHSLLN